VLSSGDRPNVISIPNTLELLWNTLHTWDIHRAQRVLLFIQTTAALGINGRVNETLGRAVEPMITCQAANFINQIFSCYLTSTNPGLRYLNSCSYTDICCPAIEVSSF
jgi:hypothetical protein